MAIENHELAIWQILGILAVTVLALIIFIGCYDITTWHVGVEFLSSELHLILFSERKLSTCFQIFFWEF